PRKSGSPHGVFGAWNVRRAASAVRAASAAALMAASVLVVLGSNVFVPEGACARSPWPHHPDAAMMTAASATRILLRITTLLLNVSAVYSMRVRGRQATADAHQLGARAGTLVP